MKPRHVLLVEDEPGIRSALSSALEKDGYRCSCARDGEEALKLARQDWPDLVITDLRMDGQGGLYLMRALHEERPSIPIVVITGFGMVEDFIAARRLGAVDFVLKPFRLQEIREAIDRCPEQVSPASETREIAADRWSRMLEEFGPDLLPDGSLEEVTSIEILCQGKSGESRLTLAPVKADQQVVSDDLPELQSCLWS